MSVVIIDDSFFRKLKLTYILKQIESTDENMSILTLDADKCKECRNSEENHNVQYVFIFYKAVNNIGFFLKEYILKIFSEAKIIMCCNREDSINLPIKTQVHYDEVIYGELTIDKVLEVLTIEKY